MIVKMVTLDLLTPTCMSQCGRVALNLSLGHLQRTSLDMKSGCLTRNGKVSGPSLTLGSHKPRGRGVYSYLCLPTNTSLTCHVCVFTCRCICGHCSLQQLSVYVASEIDDTTWKMDETEADISCITKHEGLNQYHDQNCRHADCAS